MRALPRMTVTAVCDAEEMTRLMDATLDWPHPIYIRLGKGGDPVISKPERGFAIGKAIDMIDGETGPSDVLLVATGVATTQALKAAGSLAADGIRCRLLHLHTVKPIDADAIVDAAAETKLVVTVEEHSVVGGLGSAVLETLSDRLTGALPPLKRLGIPDKFADHYGSQAKLMEEFRFDAKGIDATVRKLLAELRR
jgi:transketolase